jgi:hypothetical protein
LGGDRERRRPDTLVAPANAYLAALNKLTVKRQRGKP